MVLLGDKAQVEARFGLFGDGANLDARQVHSLGRTYHRLGKSFWTHPMELLGDVAHLGSCFGTFRDGVSVGAREVHGLCQTYHRLRNCFGRTHWYSYVMRLKWKLVSFHLGIVLILTQDRCTVCVERTIGSKIILDAPDGTRW
jgi:hypothetical protein